jgi:hypothetical protein
MISRQSFSLINKALQHEEMHLSNYQSFDDVSRRLDHFIEDLRKNKRLQSAPGHLTPEQY